MILDKMNPLDKDALQGLAKDREIIVEIGTFMGAGTEALLEANELGHVITIDTYRHTPTLRDEPFTPAETMMVVMKRLERFGNRVTVIQGESLAMADMFEPESIDMVYLDGAHDYENVKEDIISWAKVVKPKGLVTGHDYNKFVRFIREDFIEEQSKIDRCPVTNIHFGVAKAVHELCPDFYAFERNDCSIWWAEKEMIKL